MLYVFLLHWHNSSSFHSSFIKSIHRFQFVLANLIIKAEMGNNFMRSLYVSKVVHRINKVITNIEIYDTLFYFLLKFALEVKFKWFIRFPLLFPKLKCCLNKNEAPLHHTELYRKSLFLSKHVSKSIKLTIVEPLFHLQHFFKL